MSANAEMLPPTHNRKSNTIAFSSGPSYKPVMRMRALLVILLALSGLNVTAGVSNILTYRFNGWLHTSGTSTTARTIRSAC